MSHPFFHAKSSARKFGAEPDDYIAIHSWFDSCKAIVPDARHRLYFHNSFGIFLCETIFGLKEHVRQLENKLEESYRQSGRNWEEGIDVPGDYQLVRTETPVTFARKSDGKQIPIRLIGEQHCIEDSGGKIHTLAEILEKFPKDPELYNHATRLSKEFENE